MYIVFYITYLKQYWYLLLRNSSKSFLHFSLMFLVFLVTICLMNGFICSKAQVAGTTQDHLQIFNIELKAKIKSHQMPEQVTIFPVQAY